MELKVRCLDDRFSKRQGDHAHRLEHGKIYHVHSLSNAFYAWANRDGSSNVKKMVTLKEIPSEEYLPRRFEIVSKEIVITLPNDFDKLPIT